MTLWKQSYFAMNSITLPAKDLQDYEAAILVLLSAVHTVAAQLDRENHPLAAPLKAELRKALFAQGSWRIAKWIAFAQEQGGQPA